MRMGKGPERRVERTLLSRSSCVAGLLALFTLIGCSPKSAPMPPDGHVFLTVVILQNGGPGILPDCLVRLEPLFGEPATVTPSSGTSNQDGRVEFVQPHGSDEIFADCPGVAPSGPQLADLEGPGITYAEHQVIAGTPQE